VREIIEDQKTGTRKIRKDAVLVNEFIVTLDRDFFEQLDPVREKELFEASMQFFSERYDMQNIAYAIIHKDEQTKEASPQHYICEAEIFCFEGEHVEITMKSSRCKPNEKQ
jgi:hypothetical protein